MTIVHLSPPHPFFSPPSSASSSSWLARRLSLGVGPSTPMSLAPNPTSAVHKDTTSDFHDQTSDHHSSEDKPRHEWDAEKYIDEARYVPRLASDLVDLLRPVPGERVLDIGCGDGELTVKLALNGSVQVVGIDASPELVKAAQARGVDARLMDAHRLACAEEYDAAFSNATLHWMKRPRQVVGNVYRSLRPGGRFVGEFGGDGNVASIVEALKSTLDARGIVWESVNPWYFPTKEEFRDVLESSGFYVEMMDRFARPTELPSTGVRGWLELFADGIARSLPEEEREGFLDEVAAAWEHRRSVAPRKGPHEADYVRLRFVARKLPRVL